MSQDKRIRTAFERNAKALHLRPGIGRGTAVTTARRVEGLTFEVTEGDWELTVDMGEKSGGNNRGPNPGVYGRGTLASCLAVSYGLWSAYRNVPLTRLDVEVQADYDSRGDLGVDDVPPGYEEIRYVVTVESPEPEQRVRALLDEADSHCAYLAIFRDPQTVRREVRVVGRGGGESTEAEAVQ